MKIEQQTIEEKNLSEYRGVTEFDDYLFRWEIRNKRGITITDDGRAFNDKGFFIADVCKSSFYYVRKEI